MANRDVSDQPMNAPQMDTRPFDQDAPYDQDTDKSYSFHDSVYMEVLPAGVTPISQYIERRDGRQHVKTVLLGTSGDPQLDVDSPTAETETPEQPQLATPDEIPFIYTGYENKVALGGGLAAITLGAMYFATNRFENIGYNVTHPGEVIMLGREVVRYVLNR